MVEEALGYRLPAPVGDGSLEALVRSAVTASGRTVVALDDDPTGVQTVHDVAVLADWEVRDLADELHGFRVAAGIGQGNSLVEHGMARHRCGLCQ